VSFRNGRRKVPWPGVLPVPMDQDQPAPSLMLEMRTRALHPYGGVRGMKGSRRLACYRLTLKSQSIQQNTKLIVRGCAWDLQVPVLIYISGRPYLKYCLQDSPFRPQPCSPSKGLEDVGSLHACVMEGVVRGWNRLHLMKTCIYRVGDGIKARKDIRRADVE